MIFAFGGLLEASGGVLGASCAVWRPSWASGNDLGATRGSLGPSRELLEAILAREGPRRGRVTVPEAHATHPGRAQEIRAGGGSGPLGNYNLSGLHELWGTPLRAEGTVADIYIYIFF